VGLAVAALAGILGPVPGRAEPRDDAFHRGRRVLHVNSYHPGNIWSDRIAAAVTGELEAQGVEVRTVYLDAKRRAASEQRAEAARLAMREIEAFAPDVVTLADDDAATDVLRPYLKDARLPAVFCGLNWDASAYGLPFSNTTGMVEVSPIPQLLKLLRRHAKGDRVGVISEDTTTKRKELHFHSRLFGIEYDRIYLVSTFRDWSEAFLRAQQEVDMLLVLGVGAIGDWDTVEAGRLALAETRVPSGTDFEWLMNVSLFGIAKIPEEQGRWAARAALRIMDGVHPSRIPLTYNRESDLLFNPRIGDRLGIGNAPALAKLSP
jgi:hypothetical protein